MSIARKLKDDHPDDWADVDMSEAIAMIAESGLTEKDFQ